jgi:hypothetical protein
MYSVFWLFTDTIVCFSYKFLLRCNNPNSIFFLYYVSLTICFFSLIFKKKLCYSYGKNYNRIWRSKGLDHLCQDSDDDEMESTDM